MSLIKRGVDAAMAGSGKGGHFLKLQTDVPMDVVLAHGLDGIQSVDQHDWWDFNPAPHLVCLGEGCPSCALGNTAGTKSYIGVITKEQEVKYLPAGAQIIGQLQKYEKAVGDLTGKVVRFEKNGVGLKTKYSVILLGKKLDVSKFVLPDLEELVGPLTIAGQIEVLTNAGIDCSGLTVKKPAPVAAKPAAGKKATKPAPVETPAETVAEEATEDKAPWDDETATEETTSGWAEL